MQRDCNLPRIIGFMGMLAALVGPALGAEPDTLSCAGRWRCQLDAKDAGLAERWFERTLSQEINLPGSLPEQGFGDDVTVATKWTGGIVDRSWFTAPEYEPYREPGHVKIPFWLQPEKYYVGAAWYQRQIEVPAAWQDKRVVLNLERPHWETRVWVDGKIIGTNNALGTPHEFDLGAVTPGAHQLTVRVDNRMVVDVGQDSHSVSDHTQGNWNGIVGRIELRATPKAWLDDVQVFPDVTKKSVRVQVRLGSVMGQAGRGTVQVAVRPKADGAIERAWVASLAKGDLPWGQQAAVDWPATNVEVALNLPADTEAWDEFNPKLQTLLIRLQGPAVEDSRTVTFGLREISTQGTQFLINGRKTFFRGTLECCIFPKTGHPPTDLDSWKRIISVAKAHGLNLIRFHSWCPPKAAFVAADELGFYFHVECSSWANSSTTLGDGKPIDSWIYQEADRILKYDGNHPSFLLMPYGNEPGGARHAAFLAKWVSHYRALDSRRLYTSGAGWPQLAENQFHVTPDPRIQAWGGGLNSRINARPPETRTDYRDYIRARQVPVISHEIGQWCVYPNFDEIPKYTGYLKPRNFEIFRDVLDSHHLGDLAQSFLLASGKLQTLCYKEDIESALRTPGMGGFELLDLHDFPGQGTALVGVLDPFWESKGYVTAEEFSRFCNSTVPLARLGRRVFTTDESLEADLEVAHFGPALLADARTTWRLVTEDGRPIANGQLSVKTIPVDNGVALGHLSLDLKTVPAPVHCKLIVRLVGSFAWPKQPGAGAPAQPPAEAYQNDWDLWVYPAKVETQPPPAVTVVNDLTEQAVSALDAGGRVLLLIPPQRVQPDPKLGKIALGFSSIFWNTAWTHRQPPHTLGILCDPKHPALSQFPTEDHSDWQWWYLVSQAGAMRLDDLPAGLRPTIQVIDDWVTARKLGLLFECRVGQGRLLVCSIDLQNNLEQNPVARQLRHSLLDYMAGDQFKPALELTTDQVRSVLSRPSTQERLGARIFKADSFEPGFEPANVLDGNPSTIWHTAYTAQAPDFPHELQLEFKAPTALRGFTVLPRQDNNPNGWIKDYAVYVSLDGRTWGEPVAKGTFPNDAQRQTVTFAQPQRARYIRLVALRGYSKGPWASLAEWEMLTDEK